MNFNYEAENQTLVVNMSQTFQKWTKINVLLLGAQGERLIKKFKIEGNQPDPTYVTTKFEGVNFEPRVVIPNFDFSDFVIVELDQSSLNSLFLPQEYLAKYITEGETKQMILESLKDLIKNGGANAERLIHGLSSFCVLSNTGYLGQLNAKILQQRD